MSQPVPRTLITIATYNELENLPALVDEIHIDCPHADILVIDDNSPDGTGHWALERTRFDRHFFAIQRQGKLGLGSAILEGMRFAIDRDYDFVVNLDGDQSHQPTYISALIELMKTADVAIGSRYVPSGGVPDWPWHRRMMSKAVNAYARSLLGLNINDCSGAFRCYRVSSLEKLDFGTIRSTGFAFQEEILFHLKRLGARFAETPIIFTDRQYGRSKINTREIAAALWTILMLGLKSKSH